MLNDERHVIGTMAHLREGALRRACALMLAAVVLPGTAGAATSAVRLGAPHIIGRVSIAPRVALSTAQREPSARRSEPRLMISSQVLAAGVGGSLAGGLHALTGPDHVACVLPICVGRRWWSAVRCCAAAPPCTFLVRVLGRYCDEYFRRVFGSTSAEFAPVLWQPRATPYSLSSSRMH